MMTMIACVVGAIVSVLVQNVAASPGRGRAETGLHSRPRNETHNGYPAPIDGSGNISGLTGPPIGLLT